MKKMFENNAVQLEKSIRNEAMRTIDGSRSKSLRKFRR